MKRYLLSGTIFVAIALISVLVMESGALRLFVSIGSASVGGVFIGLVLHRLWP